MYGEGSWDDIGEEWEEVVKSSSQEVREIIE